MLWFISESVGVQRIADKLTSRLLRTMRAYLGWLVEKRAIHMAVLFPTIRFPFVPQEDSLS